MLNEVGNVYIELCFVVSQRVCMDARQAASLDQRAASSSRKNQFCKNTVFVMNFIYVFTVHYEENVCVHVFYCHTLLHVCCLCNYVYQFD